jgi:CubicO group peptidase (beta-lactamase class C family)
MLCALAACPTSPRSPAGPAASGPAASDDARQRLARLCFEQPGVQTDALLVYHRGRLVFSRYEPPRGDPRKKHLAWSITKTVFAAWLGYLERRGELRRDVTVCDAYPDARQRDERLCRITAQSLLEMSSGLDWNEQYEDAASLDQSSVVRMLYGGGIEDAPRFVLTHAPSAAPGQRWRYSSGDANLLSGIVRQTLGEPRYRRSFFEEFLPEIGAPGATLETDRQGNLVASSYLHLTAEELARFGLWLLREARAPRALPPGWLERALRPAPAMHRAESAVAPQESYGWYFWLNKPVAEKHGARRPWPSAPEDAFAALGHWGQKLFVIPSEDVVVVRFGEDVTSYLDNDQLLQAVLHSIGRAR